MGNSQGKPVLYTDQVNLNHFKLLRVVGKGAFGKVRVVERKDSGLTFALKYIRKDEVVRSENVRNIIRERRMLEHLNHPFLCNLRYSFQDVEYLYLVVDLMNGGDLRFHIQRKTFTEECVRFWMAELACALRYIHKQGIVHRDVKPDNILLDSQGHVHLADFNVASDFTPSSLLVSRSGTLTYLAPEVLRGTGYLSEVDWWSLGVTFYECIYGKRPFEGKSQQELVANICSAKANFLITNPPVSLRCMRAVAALLEKDPRRRLGARSFTSFVQDEFFLPVDFEALEQKQIPPIFVPSSEKANFDATYDLEELLLEEAPLEARARKQKPRPDLRADATEQERREHELHTIIETMFEPFDYTLASFRDDTATVLAQDPALRATSESRIDPRTVSQARTPGVGTAIIASDDDDLTHDMADHGPRVEAPKAAGPSASRRPGAALRSISFGRNRPQAPIRTTSDSGGLQMVLDATGSWSLLAETNTATPSPAPPSTRPGKESGSILGLLRGRASTTATPKSKEPGVLGKAGVRQVISPG